MLENIFKLGDECECISYNHDNPETFIQCSFPLRNKTISSSFICSCYQNLTNKGSNRNSTCFKNYTTQPDTVKVLGETTRLWQDHTVQNLQSNDEISCYLGYNQLIDAFFGVCRMDGPPLKLEKFDCILSSKLNLGLGKSYDHTQQTNFKNKEQTDKDGNNLSQLSDISNKTSTRKKIQSLNRTPCFQAHKRPPRVFLPTKPRKHLLTTSRAHPPTTPEGLLPITPQPRNGCNDPYLTNPAETSHMGPNSLETFYKYAATTLGCFLFCILALYALKNFYKRVFVYKVGLRNRDIELGDCETRSDLV